MGKERNQEQDTNNFIIHVVCWAGSDRSKYIADELTKRGYIASHGGVLIGHNYTTPEDLAYVNTVIFTDDTVRRVFKKDKGLTRQLRANNARSIVFCLTEEEKDIAMQNAGKLEELKNIISAKLDFFGFGYRKMKY